MKSKRVRRNKKNYKTKDLLDNKDTLKSRNLKRNKKNVIIFTSVALLIIFIILLIFGYKMLCPKIVINGKKNITINYKTKYVDKGYKASYFGENISNLVKTEGMVNTKKLGTYKIIYKVNKGLFYSKVVRTVRVRDLSKPTIELPTTGDIYVCKDAKYEVENFKSFDNYDGDLTKKVKVKITDTYVTYSVTDTSGNIKSIQRKIIHKDKEAPVITLNGDNPVTIYIGDTYNEAGYTAIDNCDTNDEVKVKASGDVDSSKLGTYTITYSSTDTSGNKAEVTRKVNVIDHNVPGTIYLTFDDGPKSGTTNVILDILREENVKATFFVTSGGPDELIKREYDEGHTVALHTSTHNYQYLYSSVDAYFEDLGTVESRVFNITGYHSKIIRFPGGSSNTISRKYCNGIMTSLSQETLKRGFRYYDWNITSGDAGEVTTANGVYNNVVRRLSKDRVNVVLMHDIKPYTRDAVKRIIQYGKNNGYTFDKITESTEMVTQRVNN